jgi:hypothetical protein
MQHLPEERACMLVELPAQRPRAAVEDEHSNLELGQVVGGFDSK